MPLMSANAPNSLAARTASARACLLAAAEQLVRRRMPLPLKNSILSLSAVELEVLGEVLGEGEDGVLVGFG